ncbi:S1/P1 nuclease [Hymenobacter roseosalivarius DSM 11622]|uniref:S1/P1 nuclease n=1 Tax=Hymenobacter roseosalivarius DSM 11622 TaxID=645990 RepID=A0A1W1VZY1_9BACT|nr:S1/P1 nuclease [Hymenobacter roseosalivarius]SMB98932.1 S1/P1 nuclease [Hymenobacter roseosalivarius DSM 11622]
MRKRFLPLLLLLLTPLSLWAWGVDGHRAVGKIAEQHLSRRARREVQQLLRTETVTMVSTWPDEIRSDPQFKETGPWHYVNTPSGLNHEQYVQQLKAQTDPNAYNAMLAQLAILKDGSKTQAERVAALKFVVHLVGDVHQPLHAGHAEDKGGNDIKVKFRGRDTNLHSLWDSGLLDYQGLTYTEMATAYDARLRGSVIRKLQATPPEEWLWESYQASNQIYQETPTNTDIDYRYYPAHADLMRQRIIEAGVRLAGVLNKAFR